MGRKGCLPPHPDPAVESRRNANRRFRAKNRALRREWNDAWMETNADRFTYLRVQSNARRRRAVLCLYSDPPKCCLCGFDRVDGLVLDHIENDGATHRKELKINSRSTTGGGNMYEYIRRNGKLANLQILCANCNAIKQARLTRRTTLKGSEKRALMVEEILEGKRERDLTA